MNRIDSVEPLQDYILRLVFDDGHVKVVDVSPFVGSDALSGALKDPAYLKTVRVESGGGITWPNGYDFCPNFLRDEVPAAVLEMA